MTIQLHAVVLLAVLGTAAAPPLGAQSPAATQPERGGARKESLQQNHARLPGYEWIQTTVISLKEEKHRTHQRCYHGADGKVQKLPIADAAPQASQGGSGRRGGRLRQRVVENKKEDMREYMERAAALMHRYEPPSPSHEQKASEAGGLSLRPATHGARLEFTGCLQPGDMFSLAVATAATRLTAISVATYLEKPDEPVSLAVRFAALDDGTSYPAQTTLGALEKHIRIVIENSGYRPTGR